MELTPAELAALASGRPLVIQFVRHAETEYNTQHLLQGWSDSAITELGARQITAVAKQLEATNFDLVLSSDLPRSRTTTEGILARQPKHPEAEYLELLREWNFGGLERRPGAEVWSAVAAAQGIELDPDRKVLRAITDRIGWAGLFNEVALLDATGVAENGSAVVARAEAAVAHIVKAAAAVPGSGEASVLVVSHGGFIGSMLRQMFPSAPPDLILPNCSVTTVTLAAGSDEWSLEALGETVPAVA